MSKTVEKLKPRLKQLSAEEKKQIVEFLLEALDASEGDSEQMSLDATLNRRLEEIQSGKEIGVSEAEFLAQLRKEFP